VDNFAQPEGGHDHQAVETSKRKDVAVGVDPRELADRHGAVGGKVVDAPHHRKLRRFGS